MALETDTSRLALTVNAGSSSVRLSVWSLEEPRARRLRVEHLGGDELAPRAALAKALAGLSLERVALVAHRVVHGGRRSRAGVIDAALEAEIVEASKLAPLHNPR